MEQDAVGDPIHVVTLCIFWAFINAVVCYV